MVTMVSSAVCHHSNQTNCANPRVEQLCGAVNDSPIADGRGAERASVPNASRNERKAMRVTLLKVAVNLACRGFLGAFEAMVVQKMISQENAVLTAAFKVGNMTPSQSMACHGKPNLIS